MPFTCNNMKINQVKVIHFNSTNLIIGEIVLMIAPNVKKDFCPDTKSFYS